NLFESLALCDPLFSPCIGDGFDHRGRRVPAAPAAEPTHTIALALRGSSATTVIPRDGRAARGTGFVRKAPTPDNRPIEPRARAPLLLPRERMSFPIQAVPLGPGRSVLASASARPAVPARRRVVSAPAEPALGLVVGLTLTPTRVREGAPERPGRHGSPVL